MLRRLGIRAKVLAVLAVPVLVLLVAASYISVQAVTSARTAAAVEDVVRVLPKYADVVEALQQERTLSVQTVSGVALSGSLSASRSSTDQALTALGLATTGLDVSPLDTRVAEAIATAGNAQANVSALRDRVDAESIPSSLVDSNYTDIVSAANDVPALVAETLSERSLASRLTAYGLIADTIEQVLRADPTVQAVFVDNGSDAAEVREIASLFAVQDQARADARTATNNLRLAGIQVPSRNADLTAMQLSLESGNELTISALDETRWNALVNEELAALRPVADDLLDSASSQASTLATNAQREALVTIGAATLATLLSIVIAFIVSRGIVVPLRRLTSAAGEVREELPRLVEQVAVPGESPDLTLAEIPVESSDEVGRLAAAFNSVNATTIQVARDQAALRGSIAEMFVNVARRDQVLLGRQLSFIDSLERSEEDPATLANLFRLDHLATRMRRNAESLLVLAGIDSGRRLREAMPLSDVVRTASSEIEQYDRVQLELRADPLMHGFNALAAAHLLAELLENATLFSEPGTPVVVSTGVEGDLVTVQVIDQGLGMTPDELAEANATIGASAATDAIGAQRLGLFVVARLARRLGAHVRLERASGSHSSSGTVAVVSFPAALFTSHDPALAGQPARREPAPQTGAIPEAPVAVPVDLAALTDGATSTGLPKRRVAGEQPPAEPDVVLPAPTEATLAPEIAAATPGWAPAVVADGPAALPTRGGASANGAAPLPTRGGGADLPTRTPSEPVAPQMSGDAPTDDLGPRSGLFAGFRGRDALPRLTELPVPVDQPAPADQPAVEVAPVAWSDADVVDPLALPGQVDATAVAFPGLVADEESETEQAVVEEPAALLIPGLVPDEPEAEDDAWSWSAEAPAEPTVPSLLPDEEPDVAQPAAWAADPLGAPAPAATGWAPTEPTETAEPAWASAPPPVWSPEEPAAWSTLPAPGADLAPQTPVDAPAAWAPPVAEPAAAPAAWAQPVPEPVAEPAAEPVADWTQAPPPVLPTWSADQHWAAPVDDAPAAVAPLDGAAAFAPVEQEPALPTRASAFSAAASAPAAPFADPVSDDAPPALPDFASLVQGDGADEAPHRVRSPKPKRSLFSFGRRRPAVAEPAPVAPAAAPVVTAPTAWPSVASAPAGLPTVPPAPAVPAPAEAFGPWTVAPVAEPLPQPFVTPAPFEQTAVADPALVAPVLPEAPAFGGWTPSAEPEAAWAPQLVAPAEDEALTDGWSAAPVAQPTALPTRTPAPVPPPVDEPAEAPADRSTPRNVSAWASAWSPEGGTGGPAASWSAGPAATAAPDGNSTVQRSGALDAEAAAMLAQRADIQEQALSELSQLSAYRPTVVDRPANGSLTRRVPTAIPAAPEIAGTPEATASRDADGLRDRLSSFQSGTRRGRRAQAEPQPGETSPEAEPIESDQQPTSSTPSW